MEHLKKIGAGFLDSVGATRNKAPPDDLMVSCNKQLTSLRDEIIMVQQQFSQYSHQVVEAAEASVTLSKSVARFYSRANHPGRSESVNMYKKVQEDIANSAVKTFHITVENGLLNELSEWIQTIADVHEKITAAESTRITAFDTQNRLLSLQNELKDKKSAKKTLFSGNRESDIDDLQQRISESSEAQKSLSLEYKSQRNNIAQQVKQLMEKRYRYFDRIYVQMLECQSEFFQHAATVSKRFQRDIDYYRKQYPKTNEFHNNNGSVHWLDGTVNCVHDEAQGLLASPTVTGISTSASTASSSASSMTESESKSKVGVKMKPAVPVNKPPNKPPKRKIINSNNTSPPSASISTSLSTPAQVQKQQQQHKTQVISNGNHANNGLQQMKLGSTHDILNLHGPMSPQLPKVKKQDSLLTGLFGSGGGGGGGSSSGAHISSNNNDNGDPHDLFNLVNPHRNDMLNMNVSNGNNAPEQKSSNGGGGSGSGGGSGDPNDIFGDFFGNKTDMKPPIHGSQDSTTDWILGSHEPAQEKEEIHVHDKSKGSMEEQMRNTFNAPSYNGHNTNNINGMNVSPIIASQTSKAPRNGAETDLSVADKKKLVNMKLSRRGQENAKKAYEDAMGDRMKEEAKAAEELREKMYWKDKHEVKLKRWEFENTVRRNIRTLIGKLPEVLPNYLNWKPIPMTKLLNDAQLKKGYYKAVRVVHPDKSIGRGDSVEARVICDYVFQALEQAFNTKFG